MKINHPPKKRIREKKKIIVNLITLMMPTRVLPDVIRTGEITLPEQVIGEDSSEVIEEKEEELLLTEVIEAEDVVLVESEELGEVMVNVEETESVEVVVFTAEIEAKLEMVDLMKKMEIQGHIEVEEAEVILEEIEATVELQQTEEEVVEVVNLKLNITQMTRTMKVVNPD